MHFLASLHEVVYIGGEFMVLLWIWYTKSCVMVYRINRVIPFTSSAYRYNAILHGICEFGINVVGHALYKYYVFLRASGRL